MGATLGRSVRRRRNSQRAGCRLRCPRGTCATGRGHLGLGWGVRVPGEFPLADRRSPGGAASVDEQNRRAFAHLTRLTQYGVQFESLQEQFFGTTGPFGDMLIALFACMAKIERERISERTKAGVARARAEGKKCGRPIKVFRRDEALRLSREGNSGHEIGRLLQVSEPTIRRLLQAEKGRVKGPTPKRGKARRKQRT
jgi:hypothetical protein